MLRGVITKSWKKMLVVVMLCLLVGSAVIRLKQTANYQFPFTFDQARDMLNIRIMGTFKGLKFIGPTTSVNGLLLGPGYYYFNLIPFWVGRGNPQALVDWNTGWFLVAGAVAFWLFYKKNVGLGLVIATIYLWAPQLFNTTRYFWNAHSMIYVAMGFFLALWNYVDKKSIKNAMIMGTIAGIGMQFEAAMAVVMVGFSMILVFSSRNRRLIGWFLISILPWFLPQIAIEITKGGIMTKTLLTEFSGKYGILGNKLSYALTWETHWKTMQTYFEGQLMLPYGWGKICLLITMMTGLWSKKYHQQMLGLIGFLAFTMIFYELVFRYELKSWYGDSLRVWYLLVVATGIVAVAEKISRWPKIRLGYWLIIIIFLIRSIYLTIGDQKQFINNPDFAKDDPALMDHLIKTVDWAYQQTKGESFRAYNYLPETYDYQYQYVYWWYGRAKYGYMPTELTYLPGADISYVPKSQLFKEKGGNFGGDEAIVLLYEKKLDYQSWLHNFDQYCLIEKIDFGWQVSGEIREKCN